MNRVINGRYELIKKIGSGGMADVYLAKDLVLNREVALKVLRGDLSSDPVSLLRFQREANAGSGLNHPNVVEIYDVGQEDRDQYIVMEYIEGVTAKELINRRGVLDVKEAVDFMYQLALGVSKAHKQGIVHRDIKPQNILVKGDGTLKISDFGIAQSGDALQLTKTDSVIGSIHYLAPECVRGEKASFQSDIYAMGILFYEILTGEVPFSGEMPVEIAMKHLKDPIPSVQAFNPAIPNSIVNIINKATSKNIKSRFRTVDQFIEELTTALDPKREHELLWVPQLDTTDDTKLIQVIKGVEEGEFVEVVDTSKKKRSMIIGGVVAALALIAVIILLVTNKNKDFLMLDITGKSLEEAREVLREHNIYISNSIEYEFSDLYEKGQIIKTLPEAGKPVEKGSQVKVVVSNGSYFKIEDYSGKLAEDIKALLEENTRLTVRIVKEISSKYSNGVIIRQEGIEPGESIDPEARLTITLVVAGDLELLMPNVLGVNILQAKKDLEDLGIKVHLNNMPILNANGINYDVVISTNPHPGTYYIQTSESVVILDYYDSEDKPLPEEETDGIVEGE